MLPLPIVETFDSALLELPALLETPLHERTPRAEKWLTQVTAQAERFRLPLAADLALIRADLTTYRPGREEWSADRRRMMERHVCECMEQAKDLIDSAFARQRALCEQGGEICLQLAAAACARRLIARGESVQAALAALRADEALFPALTQVIGTVGSANAAILLDRALAQI